MTENIHFLSGVEKCKQESYEEAVHAFTLSLSVDPQHVASFFNRGLSRLKLRQYEKAIKDFDEAIRLQANHAEFYSEKGVALHHLGRQREALDNMNQACRLEPENAYRYSSRAYIRAFIGDTQGGIEDYEKAIALDPEDAISLNNLGLLEEKLGYKDKANEHFQKADNLVDAGKSFEKPDVDQILKEYESRQEAQAQAKTIQDQMPATSSTSPTWRAYWKEMRQVFIDKESFGDFLNFLKKTLALKNSKKIN